ncbi:MAG: hypothetical protein FGM62_03000 [Methylobacterium sp.]|nr:hypothetical protein [Methylobacterium sp.]
MNLNSSLRGILMLLLTLGLTACGFHFRGLADLSFQSIYIQQGGAVSISSDLQRSLTTNGVKVVNLPEQAEMQLDLMGETTDKRILSLSGSGRVREYELIYRVTFRTRSASDQPWSAPQTIETRRDFTYDDTVLLAKQAEETRLYNDMRSDASREMLRRLSALSSGKSMTAQ